LSGIFGILRPLGILGTLLVIAFKSLKHVEYQIVTTDEHFQQFDARSGQLTAWRISGIDPTPYIEPTVTFASGLQQEI
jgi:hypothetical protein